MENSVLNSWKEISTYTGRGIRTLQRWERERGFPVRRPRGTSRSAVIAIKVEIDGWMRAPHESVAEQKAHHIHVETHTRLLDNTQVLHLRASTLLSRSEILAKQVARAVELGSAMCTPRDERKNWAGNVVRATELGNPMQNSALPAKRVARQATRSH